MPAIKRPVMTHLMQVQEAVKLGNVDGWKTVAWQFFKMQEISSTETWQAQQAGSQVTHQGITRADIHIRPQMRLLADSGDVYEIVALRNEAAEGFFGSIGIDAVSRPALWTTPTPRPLLMLDASEDVRSIPAVSSWGSDWNSGVGLIAIGGQEPLWSESGPRQRPAIEFAGTNQLTRPSLMPYREMTFAAIVKGSIAAQEMSVAWMSQNGNAAARRWELAITPAGSWILRAQGSDGSTVDSVSVTPEGITNWHLVVATIDANEMILRAGGTAGAALTSSLAATQSAKFRLGAITATPDAGAKVSISWAALWHRPLDLPTIDSIAMVMQDRWGVA